MEILVELPPRSLEAQSIQELILLLPRVWLLPPVESQHRLLLPLLLVPRCRWTAKGGRHSINHAC